MKINLGNEESVTDADWLNVFRKGFEILGKNSPFVSKKLFVYRVGNVIWLAEPEFSGKSETVCSLHLNEEMLQFNSDHRKFNQLAAINELFNLGVLHHPVWRVPESDVDNLQVPTRGRPKKPDAEK